MHIYHLKQDNIIVGKLLLDYVIKIELTPISGCLGRINLLQNGLMFVEYLVWVRWPSPAISTPMHNTFFCISLTTSCHLPWKFEAIIFDNNPLPYFHSVLLG